MAASGIQKKDVTCKKDQDHFEDFVDACKSGDLDSLDVGRETPRHKWYEERLTMLAYAKGTLEFEKRTLEKRVEAQAKEIEELKSRLRIKSITMKQNEEIGHELRILKAEAKMLHAESKKQIAEKDQTIAYLMEDLHKWKTRAELRAINLEDNQREIAELIDGKLILEKELDSLKLLQTRKTQGNQAMVKEFENLKLKLEELLRKCKGGPNGTEIEGLSEMDRPLECCFHYVHDLELVLEEITKQNQVVQKREGVALVERDDLRQKYQMHQGELHRLSEELKIVKLERERNQVKFDQFSRKEKEWKASIAKLQSETARLSRRLRDELKEKLYLHTDLQRCKLRFESCSPQRESNSAAKESGDLNPEELLFVMPVVLKCIVEVHGMLNDLTKEPELLPQQISTLEAAKGIIWDLKELTKGKL